MKTTDTGRGLFFSLFGELFCCLRADGLDRLLIGGENRRGENVLFFLSVCRGSLFLNAAADLDVSKSAFLLGKSDSPPHTAGLEALFRAFSVCCEDLFGSHIIIGLHFPPLCILFTS